MFWQDSPESKEAKLWSNTNVKSCDELWEVAHYEAQGCRKTMEDAHVIRKQFGGHNSRLLAGVFDGHGGARCAKFVADSLSQKILDHDQLEGNPSLTLKETFLAVDNMWLCKAKSELEDGKPLEDGSTAIVCMILNQVLWVANTGDSRAFLSRGGELVELSEDHKPDSPEEKARIEKAGGTVTLGRVAGNLSVARAFGDFPYKQENHHFIIVDPDVTSHQMTPDINFIVLACDGLFEEMSPQEIHDFISMRLATNVPLGDICKLLVDECLDLGTQDNVSIIIIKVGKPYQKILKQSEKYKDQSLKKSQKNQKKSSLSKSTTIQRDEQEKAPPKDIKKTALDDSHLDSSPKAQASPLKIPKVWARNGKKSNDSSAAQSTSVSPGSPPQRD